MTVKQEVYCRLELFCIYALEECQNLKKERCFFIKDDNNFNNIKEYDVYVENFQNFKSVVNRIIELNEIWHKSELKKCWAEEIGENIIISVMLYNCQKDNMTIGISEAGWIMPGFSYYTQEYENNLIRLGKPDIKKERSFVLYSPQYTEFSESDFIPQEAACSLIKEWLDTGTYLKYFINQSIYENYCKYVSTNNNCNDDLEQIIF